MKFTLTKMGELGGALDAEKESAIACSNRFTDLGLLLKGANKRRKNKSAPKYKKGFPSPYFKATKVPLRGSVAHCNLAISSMNRELSVLKVGSKRWLSVVSSINKANESNTNLVNLQAWDWQLSQVNDTHISDSVDFNHLKRSNS